MTAHFNPGQQKAWDNLYTSASRFCLLYGGSRSGKTVLAVFAIITRALKAPFSKHLIVRQEAASARASILRGNTATIPMVIRMFFPGLEYESNEKYGYITFPNGSEIWVGGLNDEKAMERILGNEYATIYMNEASECRFVAFTLLRSRLAQVVKDIEGDEIIQRFYVDLNPTTRNHWTYRLWIDGTDPEDGTDVDLKQYGHAVINPHDNAENLSGDYLADLAALPERARRRFMEGKYVEDVDNALWRRAMFKRIQKFPDLVRVVVAVDPAVSTEPGSDETGIIAAGIDAAGVGYLLEDASGKYKPEEWAKQAIAVYDTWGADLIVAEINQGGDLVEANVRAHRADVGYKGVHATRGKVVRAEPVAGLYERGKVYHHGHFSDLEDQMCSVTVGFDRKAQGWSPDRVDAAVWAFTELFPQMTRRTSRRSGPIIRPIGTLA